MISLLLPYWRRPEAAARALSSIEKHYKGIEVIVVDDGSHDFTFPDWVKVIQNEKKDEPKSPITCWNKAAKEAKGDTLVISCIEVIHERPILEELCQIEDDEYAVAAAWCPEERRWHTHSSVHVPDCPNGTGIGFCAAIKKKTFLEIVDFDESYRDGAGYEDRDFIKTLLSHNIKFKMRDDLRVLHPKTDASISWGAEKFQRNKEIYEKKWEPSLNFVCVNLGNYLGMGAKYVNKLSEMLIRHLPDVNWKLTCITDNPAGLDNGIEVLIPPENIKGWYGKLWMFKKGLFPKGQRLIFLDLDTIIVDSLDEIIKYDGDFAVLKDFYFDRVGPAVMMWPSGKNTELYSEWEKQGFPENPPSDHTQMVGDLWWINQFDNGEFSKRADKLQDLYPNQFVSYKAHCLNGLPEGAKVVCFHGTPRPHTGPAPWVRNIWGNQELIDVENYPDAISYITERLDENPDDMSSLFQFGEILLKQDKLGVATNIYRYLSMVVPDRSEIWNNLGRCYQKRETSGHARACFKKALELDINSAPALINLAVLDVNEGNPERAKFLAQKALQITPESRQAMDVLSMAKLHLRDWSGWDEYLYSEGPPFRRLRQYGNEKEWMGEKDGTVIVYREQGLGDEIMFASCFQDAIDISKKVILDVDKRLTGLMSRSFPEADVYGTGHDTVAPWLDDYQVDYAAPIGRLPNFFRRKDPDFPGKPYLKACPLRRKAYRAMLDSLGHGKKIGIAWTGGKRTDSVTKSDSEYRSLQFEELRPLLDPDNHYISLEYRDHEEIEGVHSWPWITQSNDYDDTAALVSELDYVISVPTTVVHLAGALGKECYCLIPEHPNWRFSGDMIWHNSVKLFKGVKKLAKYLKKTKIILAK